MNKKLIRLTESDLHRIVKESVNIVLNETTPTEEYSAVKGEVTQIYQTIVNLDKRLFRIMSNYEVAKIGTALSDAIRSLRNAQDSLKEFGISRSVDIQDQERWGISMNDFDKDAYYRDLNPSRYYPDGY